MGIQRVKPPEEVMEFFEANLDPALDVKVEGLAAGWNPNLTIQDGQPVVMMTGANMTIATLSLAAAPGGTSATYQVTVMGKMGLMERLNFALRAKSQIKEFLEQLKAAAERPAS